MPRKKSAPLALAFGDRAFSPIEGAKVVGCGLTKYLQLIHAGEIDSYRVGTLIRSTGRAIRAYQAKAASK
jgi:excisionase family DNA binding protein